MNNFSASRETDYGQQFEIKHKFASNNSDEGFDEDFDGEDDFEESKGSGNNLNLFLQSNQERSLMLMRKWTLMTISRKNSEFRPPKRMRIMMSAR